MIVLSCCLMQKDLIRLIENYKIDNKQIFKLDKMTSSLLYFECDLQFEQAKELIENIISQYKFNHILFYSIFNVIDGEIQWFEAKK